MVQSRPRGEDPDRLTSRPGREDPQIVDHADRRRPWRRRALLVIPVILIAWYLVAWLRHVPADGPPAAIAHRGAPGTSGAPEGTLAAFRSSIDAGADWLEFDVRATGDGALVVLHDATVDRTTDGSGPVSSLTLAQVRALDAGGGAQVPTVDEVVALAKAAGIPVLPEIKDGPLHPAVAPALVELLHANDYADAAVVAAFEAETLARLRELAPEIPACWITGAWQFDIANPPADAAYVCPMGEMVLLDPDMVRRAHVAGRTVFAWWSFAESAVTNAILRGYGVDGLIVDDVRPLVDPAAPG